MPAPNFAYPDATYIEAQVSTGTWTNISPYVVSDAVGDYGFISTSEDARVSTIGFLYFVLDNASGYFTPNHANDLGIRKDTKIRVRVVYGSTNKVKFVGKITDFPQVDLPFGEQKIPVTVTTWEDIASEYPINNLSVQNNKRINQAVSTILGGMAKQPESTSLSTGTYVFDRVFDDVNNYTRAISEFDKLAKSEFGYIYVKGDGTLVAESREDRTGLKALSTFNVTGTSTSPEFFNDAVDLGAKHGADLVNQVNLIAYTKTLDETNVNLIDITEPVYLPQGITKKLKYLYSDPNDRNNHINGHNIVQPLVTGTHFEAYQYSTASGTNYTGQLIHSEAFYSDRAVFNFNSQGGNSYLTKLIVQGQGIYNYIPSEEIVEDDASISEHGTYSLDFDQRYQIDLDGGRAEASAIVAMKKDDRPTANILHYFANQSPFHMEAFLNLDIGNLIYAKNDESKIDNYEFIHGVRFVISEGGKVIEFWWKIKEMYCFRKGLTPFRLEFSGLLHSFAGVEFPSSPVIDNTTPFTLTWWDYRKDNVGYSMAHHPFAKAWLDSINRPTNGWLVFVDSNGYINLDAAYTVGYGKWRTSTAIMSGTADQWKFCAVGFDPNTPGTLPKFWVDGVLQSTTTLQLSSGTYVNDNDVPITIGTAHTFGNDWPNDFFGYLKDMRLYRGVLTGTSQFVSNHGNYEYETGPNLVWHGFGFRTDLESTMMGGQPLQLGDKIIEQIHGFAGTPHASGTASNYIYGYSTFPAGKYDQDHPAIKYGPAWTGILALAGYYGGTIQYSGITDSPDSYVEFEFFGTQFKIIYRQNIDRSLVDVYVDGVYSDTIDESGPPAFQVEWTSSVFANRSHIVKLFNVSGGAGAQANLDAIEII